MGSMATVAMWVMPYGLPMTQHPTPTPTRNPDQTTTCHMEENQMIDALISGKVFTSPKTGTGQSGKQYAACRVRAPASNGDSVIVSVIAFDAMAQKLQTLQEGDSVAIAGAMNPKAFTDKTTGEPRPSLDMVASQVMTAYQYTKRRQASQQQ